MEFYYVDLPEIAIIGKEGLCTKDNNVTPNLWKEATAHFGEVEKLGMKNPDGSFVGFWGAMSDEDRKFLPWSNGFTRGLYLAGLEVNMNAEAPEGWTKWAMPARRYIVVDVDPSKYIYTFNGVISDLLPKEKVRLAGGVCDYVEPATGKNKLFFPVETL